MLPVPQVSPTATQRNPLRGTPVRELDDTLG